MHHPLKPLGRRRLLALTGAAALGLLAAPALVRAAPVVTGLSGHAFGTGWRVALPSGARAEALRDRVAQLLDDVDRAMSPWRPDSEMSRFNAASAGTHPVSSETADVAGTAMRVAHASGGSFDPTVGPLVASWGFGPIQGDPGPGPESLHVSPTHIEKTGAGVTLDLCGIAKGHAIDRLSELLDAAGQPDHLIDIGGELLARGRHPSGRRWQVAVEDPRPGIAGTAEVLAIADTAVATSGSKANGYSLGGRRYSHIIDPASKNPVTGDLLSVTVIAPTAMLADAWATACMAAGETKGPFLARQQRLDALFLYADGSGLRSAATLRFNSHLA